MLAVVFKYNPVQKYGCGRLQKKLAGILNAELNFWMACKQPPKKNVAAASILLLQQLKLKFNSTGFNK